MKLLSYVLIYFLLIVPSFSQSKDMGPTHYLFPDFTKGVVLMKNGIKNEAPLNYNALTEEMLFENMGRRLAIAGKELDQVDSVFISGRKFVTLNNKFVELLYHSKCDLLAEHKCRLNSAGKPDGYGATSQTSATISYSSLSSNGTIYNLKLPEGYNTKPYTWFWLRRNNELNRFTSMRQLMKLYENKEDTFRNYAKTHKVNLEDLASVVQMIRYLEAN